ncbi:triose-phosphate isomerase [Sphingomonas oleivorans]|uniref:Triosephosphate isomerase n=1 Tax=Sphingomonas oleivorans TaxID=1735121 RepID=A0A2T5FVS6_9SPHN|nr:triose-phosphate isomerase [Sphingomonas oleivorans]PTQ09883.1 triose-phosphate isomerase [Sphingomonas oleivorans]
MALRKLVAGNWKMNGSLAALAELDAIAVAAGAHAGIDVLVCPPFTLIPAAVARAPDLIFGGQDCHHAARGAHTGCVAAGMLKEIGAAYVIVGHSERRADQHETDADVQAKARAAIAAGLIAIVCVGETEAQRDAGHAGIVVSNHLDGSVPPEATEVTLVISYEPIWAIGTGRTPSLADVAEIHAIIRAKLIDLLGRAGERVRIVYGGSVKPENAADILSVADVDGVLVGGASLTADQFVPIVEAAAAAIG